MNDAEQAKPALTAEALQHLGWYLQKPDWTAVDWNSLMREWGPHVAAALALHGQPFGFDAIDVMVLRSLAGELRLNVLKVEGETLGTTGDRLDSLADRIAALLPPV